MSTIREALGRRLSKALFLFGLFCFGCAHPRGTDKAQLLTVLHTNDVHGHAWPVRQADGIVRGGFAVQAYVISSIRREVAERGGITLVLSGGDINTGVPESDLLEGEPDFIAMNRIGYDAAALGNHELDGGRARLLKQVGWAHFPILSANVVNRTSASPLVTPSTIVERGGVRIGILGLTTESLPNIALPKHVADLRVDNIVAAARNEIQELRRKGAQIIIAVTHVGVSQSGKRVKEKIERDEVELARQLPEIAAVVGGHSHTLLRHGIAVDKRLVVQAGEKGEYLGRLDILWSPRTGEIQSETAQVIPLDITAGEDETLKTLLKVFRDEVKGRLEEPLGIAENDLGLEKESRRQSESSLGNFICDVLREQTHSDVAVYNSGGIRAGIRSGTIRMRDLYEVLPFKNTAVIGTMTGKQLRSALQTGFDSRFKGGGFLQVSGIQYSVVDGHVTQVRIRGRPLIDNEALRIAGNNFIFSGGDYLHEFVSAVSVEDTGIPVEQMIVTFLRAHPQVRTKLEGRITITP